MIQRLRLFILLIILLVPAPAGASTVVAANYRTGELVVRLVPGTWLASTALAHGTFATGLNRVLHKARAGAALPVGEGSDTYRVAVQPGIDLEQLCIELATLPGVVYAEPNYLRSSQLTSSDPLFAQQWALLNISAPEAWDITTGSTVPIAILDTGVSPTHLDLKSKLLPGYDFLNNDSDPRDDDGHGTYTAGVAAAVSDNTLGVVGVCWGCPIIPVKVLNRRGQGDDATIAQGIRWASDNGARVISMSLGGPEDTRVLRDAVAYAQERGVLVVAASGNGQLDGNLPSFPAAYDSVLAVSATSSDDRIAPFSTTGRYVDLAAPGTGVLSTAWSIPEGDTYGVASGTSAACPHVAGAAALVYSIRPALTPQQVAEILMLGALDLGTPGKDPEYGYGRLNIRQALEVASDPGVLNRSRIEGVVGGPTPSNAIVQLSSGQTTRPGADGAYRFDGMPAGTYRVSVHGTGLDVPAQQVTLSGTALSVARVDFKPAGDAQAAFQGVERPAPGGADIPLYFEATRHTLRGAFRAYWEAHGGLPIFGYPISEEYVERSEDGVDRTIQYFERHRLEYHPQNRPPYDVQLTRFGDLILQQQGRSWFSFPKSDPIPGCRFFEETGHTLCGAFLRYWSANGLEFDGRRGKSAAESLALFGQPLSEPVVETGPDGRALVAQWFERARFEDHGERGVLLGLLGNEYAQARGWR